MNQYYHGFSIGFNWWFVVAPLLAVAMIVFEARSYRLYLRTLHVYRTHNDKATLALSGLFTIIVTVMMVAESGDGVVQYFLNGLSKYESPFWSYIGLSFIAVAVFVLYWVFLFFIGKVVAYAKCGYLYEKKRQLEAARRHQEMARRRNFFEPLPDSDYPTDEPKKPKKR